MSITDEIFEAVVEGDQDAADRLVQQALDGGMGAQTVLGDGLIAAMTEVGARFEDGEYFVPDMLVSARAMKAAMARLRPLLVADDVKPVARVVIGSVQGDMHDIGKNLVALMLEGAGFEVTDLGVDVSAQRFVETARQKGADLIAISALLTTTMTGMQTVVETLAQAGMHGPVKVIVGGAAITPAFAEQIGADGFAPDASQAAELARQLVGV